jgi:hypothetical protein
MSRAPEGNSRRSQEWSEDDERILREMVAKKASKILIAAKLRRSCGAVQARMYILGITAGTGRGRKAQTNRHLQEPEA